MHLANFVLCEITFLIDIFEIKVLSELKWHCPVQKSSMISHVLLKKNPYYFVTDLISALPPIIFFIIPLK